MKTNNMTLFTLLSLLIVLITGCAVENSSGLPERDNDPASLLGKTWQWQATVTPKEKITVTDPKRYAIVFNKGGQAKIRFDCNRGGGDYQISSGRISFGPLISTRMACPPDTQDGVFMRDLQRVVSFFVENGVLYLELPLDSGTMKFYQSTGEQE